MKSIKHDLTYPGATAEQVFAMLADPEFRERVCQASGALRQQVTIVPEETGMQVTIEQVLPAEGIPAFATKFVGNETNTVQKEDWSSPTAAAVQVLFTGKPGEMNGTTTIKENADATVQSVAMEIKVSIPLVGGKLESLIADLLTKALRTENRVGTEWLSERSA